MTFNLMTSYLSLPDGPCTKQCTYANNGTIPPSTAIGGS